MLTFLSFEQEQELTKHCETFIIEEGRIHGLFEIAGLKPKKRYFIVEICLVFKFVVNWFEIIKIFVEDDADDNFIVFDRDSSKWVNWYLLMAYFQRVETTSY